MKTDENGPDPKTVPHPYFDLDAVVLYDGVAYRLESEDYLKLCSAAQKHDFLVMHSPSSWLVDRTLRLIRGKFRTLPEEQVKELAAAVLQVTTAKIDGSQEWLRQYLAWHDGPNPMR